MNRLRIQILYIKTWRLIQEVLISGMSASDGVSYFGRTGKHWTRHPIPGLESLPIGQKPTIIRFIIHKSSTHNKLRHPARGRSESLTPCLIPQVTQRSLGLTPHPVILPDLHHKRKRIKSRIHPASSFPSITPATQKLFYPLGRLRKQIY